MAQLIQKGDTYDEAFKIINVLIIENNILQKKVDALMEEFMPEYKV